jgi:hypothetical protein
VLGHRLSALSGSDKLTVFPAVGKEIRGRFHLKTSGTSWLEAVRVIAACEPKDARPTKRNPIVLPLTNAN